MPVLPDDLELRRDSYRRAILCRFVGSDAVVADLEDDFHHFRVQLGHRAGRVTSISCESVRWPWSTCPDAAANLQALCGMPISDRFTAASKSADPRANCTHQFDCAAHAIVHAFRGHGQRRYDVEVPRRDEGGETVARLWTDGEPTFAWRLRWTDHLEPETPFDGAPSHGFMAWADRCLDPETAEAAIVLKRAATIGLGRGWPFDEFDNAAQVEIGSSGVCFTMTPGRSAGAARERGMIRDFSARPEALLADVDRWT